MAALHHTWGMREAWALKNDFQVIQNLRLQLAGFWPHSRYTESLLVLPEGRTLSK